MKKAIIIFQKNAELGKVKTRLAKDLGDEKALEIYQFLCDYTHSYLKEVEADKFLYFSDYIDPKANFPKDYTLCVQDGEDLGERMYHAFHEVHKLGYDAMLIVGTDCYELGKEIIESAFLNLETYDFVIGPAKDGGYYLLGSTQVDALVFADKNWSTNSVYQDTIESFENLEVSYFELPILSDIDTVEDLKELKTKFNI